MERTYQRARDRNYAQRRAIARQQESTKMARFEKKIIIQCVASLIIFLLLWGTKAIGGDFFEYIKNKVTYAVTYTVDFKDIYDKTVQLGKDAAALLVEKPDDIVDVSAPIEQPQISNDAVIENEVSETVINEAEDTNDNITEGDDILLD